MFPVFPCTLLAPPFPVLGLDSRGVGGLMNSFPPPQGHAQNPLQVGAELQSRFFASQGCAQSPFQAAPAPPPTPQAPTAEPLQVDLLPVLAAAQQRRRQRQQLPQWQPLPQLWAPSLGPRGCL
uniref:MYC associated zinc finger protein n=1 Tax=Pipistrellus kuhlii TaxID=59472 RepID=A0A7J7S5Q8_PIPKU|nr:MYC associated zinc finger protein [Pipistrellus kuhlii]